MPGPRLVRPIYAPALVAFTRTRIGTGGARPGVGWLPLGPRDVYIPGYAASRTYVRNVNTANTAGIEPGVIDNIYAGHFRPRGYANSAIAGAITVVPRSVFSSAQPVAPHRVVLPRTGLTVMRFTSVAPAVTPVKASVLGPGAGRAVSPPRYLIDRPVVARIAPSRAPVPFEAQQTAIRANGGRPLTAGQWARLQPNRPAVPVRLAVVGWRSAPATRGGAVPSSRLQPGIERATVPNDRPPWVRAPSRNISGGAPVEQRPAVERPSFTRNRPPWTPSERSSPPRVQQPDRSAQFSHFASPASRVSPPPFESAPHFESPPRFQSAPPPAAPRAPSYHPQSPPAEHGSGGRRPPSAQAAFRSSNIEEAKWAAPPMYRAQPSPEEQPALDEPVGGGNAYAPPATPPPMYRPVGGGGFAADASPSQPHIAPRASVFASRAAHPAPRVEFRR